MGGSSSKPFSSQKCSVHLKTSRIRLQQLQNKKNNQNAIDKREIVNLLSKNKDELARIKMEQVIRDSYDVEAYELLINFVEVVIARMPVITQNAEPPANAEEALQSLIYAASLTEVPELMLFREDMHCKYGREYLESAMANQNGYVNQSLIQKLHRGEIPRSQSEAALVALANEHGVVFTPTEQLPAVPVSQCPQTYDNVPQIDLIGAEPNGVHQHSMHSPPASTVNPPNDDDDLFARFNDLKK
ncbi:hypothetical protein P9112_002189 [Eukaryota sp. TZLM1-RC]